MSSSKVTLTPFLSSLPPTTPDNGVVLPDSGRCELAVRQRFVGRSDQRVAALDQESLLYLPNQPSQGNPRIGNQLLHLRVGVLPEVYEAAVVLAGRGVVAARGVQLAETPQCRRERREPIARSYHPLQQPIRVEVPRPIAELQQVRLGASCAGLYSMSPRCCAWVTASRRVCVRSLRLMWWR